MYYNWYDKLIIEPKSFFRMISHYVMKIKRRSHRINCTSALVYIFIKHSVKTNKNIKYLLYLSL